VIIVAALVGGGLIVGLVVGRWWALIVALGIGVWIAVVSEVEVSAWFLC
jgi:hypothetical protein